MSNISRSSQCTMSKPGMNFVNSMNMLRATKTISLLNNKAV